MASHPGTPTPSSSSSSSSLVAALSFATASAAFAGIRAVRSGRAAAASAAASNAEEEADPFRPLTAFVESMVNDGVIPFITLKVERAGCEVYSHSYGAFTTPEVENAPFNSSTIARFYSMTKPVTSAAILLLWERLHGDSRFDLDAPISKYVPEWDDERVRVVVTPEDGPDPSTISNPEEFVTEPARRPITARHLLTHTAGLSYGFWPDVVSKTSRAMANAGLELPCPISDDSRRLDKSGLDYPTSLEEFCRRLQVCVGAVVVESCLGRGGDLFNMYVLLCLPLEEHSYILTCMYNVCSIGKDIPLVAHPGEEFHYSCATDVLGRLVECLDPQNRSLPEFFEDEFFTPLGMVDTAFTVSDDKLSRFAPCFAVDDNAADMDEDGHVYMVSPTGKKCRFQLASFYGVGEVSRATPFHAESTSNFKVCSTFNSASRHCQFNFVALHVKNLSRPMLPLGHASTVWGRWLGEHGR